MDPRAGYSFILCKTGPEERNLQMLCCSKKILSMLNIHLCKMCQQKFRKFAMLIKLCNVCTVEAKVTQCTGPAIETLTPVEFLEPTSFRASQ